MAGALCGTELCAGKRAWLPHSALQPSPPRFPSTLTLHSHPPLSPSTLTLHFLPTLSPSYAPLQLIRRYLPFASPLRFLSSPPFPSCLRFNHELRSVLGVWPSNILSLNALPKYPAFRAMQDICLTSCSTELCVCRTCDSVKVGSGLVGEYGCLVAFFVFRTCLAA